MNVGIIAEYNPFHKGHRLHIESTRHETGADNIIALMSGSFVQRGEPAIADKFTRTRAALLNGADMVLELPVEYATGSADVFARGAVEIFDKSGIIDTLSFGTETGDIMPFKEAAELLSSETDSFKLSLASELEKGVPYPAARLSALSHCLKRDMSFLASPNNILALEYMKALISLQSKIVPFTIKRLANDYNSMEMTGEISSASAIRQCLYGGDTKSALSALPENCHLLFCNNQPLPHIDRYSEILKYILLTTTAENLKEIDGISEGLENRILSSLSATVTETAEEIKSKRYTLSRIRRALLHIILNIKKEDALKKPGYIRVLGFRRSKAYLVSELTEKASLPVITNTKKAPEGLLDMEFFATDMYFLPLTGEKGKDFTEPLVIV